MVEIPLIFSEMKYAFHSEAISRAKHISQILKGFISLKKALLTKCFFLEEPNGLDDT